MGRKKKSISPIQADATIFTPLKEHILKVGVKPLSDYTKLDRVTVYNYLRGQPVEPDSERAILDGVEEMVQKSNEDLKALSIITRIARSKVCLT